MYSCLVISLLVADGRDLFEGFLEKMGISDIYKFISLLCFDTENTLESNHSSHHLRSH